MIKNIGLSLGFIKIYPSLLFLLGCLIIGTGSYFGLITVIEKEVIVEKEVPVTIIKGINNYKQVLLIRNDTINFFIDIEFKKDSLFLYYNMTKSKSRNRLVIIHAENWDSLYKQYSNWKVSKNSRLIN